MVKAWLGSAFNFYVLGVVAALIAGGVLASLVARRGEAGGSPTAVP